MSRHHIWQAAYGAGSAKPTHLAAHIPKFQRWLAQFANPIDWNSLEILSGRRADNSWMTASANEHPIQLKRCLAFCLASAHRDALSSNPEPYLEDEDFRQQVTRLYAGDAAFSEQIMRPDLGGLTKWDQLE